MASFSRKKIDDDLYVSFLDHNTKRKYILTIIKNSLIMQEEIERVRQIRKDKQEILLEVKKNMNNLNVEYQKLVKAFPNVKNVIEYTQKELGELQVKSKFLKKNIVEEEHEISRIEHIGNSVEELELSVKRNNSRYLKRTKEEKVSKLERITNNLKVIESKLNRI